MLADEWYKKGQYHSVLGRKIFVVDSTPENHEDKPVLCILHGFPTSSFDYHKVLEQLNQHFRVIIHDHLGFGYSDKPIDFSYSLIEQTDIALALWQQMGISKTYILAHDYGTSLLTEILVRDNQNSCPITVEKIALCNGSMHIELAKLRLMQKLLRNRLIGPLVAKFASKNTLRNNLKNIFVNEAAIDDSEIDAIWHMMRFNHGKRVLSQVSRYTFERKKFWHRWIGALKQTDIRIEIIWPNKDPIAVAKMATVILEETKNSRLHWLQDLGHFPMLEAPEKWSAMVIKQLQC